MVKFTKASKRDKTLVTVSLNELYKENVWLDASLNISVLYLSKGDTFVLIVDGVKTVFTVNRSFKTATTKAFPRHLRLPSVSRPVYADVVEDAIYLGSFDGEKS